MMLWNLTLHSHIPFSLGVFFPSSLPECGLLSPSCCFWIQLIHQFIQFILHLLVMLKLGNVIPCPFAVGRCWDLFLLCGLTHTLAIVNKTPRSIYFIKKQKWSSFFKLLISFCFIFAPLFLNSAPAHDTVVSASWESITSASDLISSCCCNIFRPQELSISMFPKVFSILGVFLSTEKNNCWKLDNYWF